jgi:hypothetical protein
MQLKTQAIQLRLPINFLASFLAAPALKRWGVCNGGVNGGVERAGYHFWRFVNTRIGLF